MSRPLPPLPSAAQTESPITTAREEALNQITRSVAALAFLSLVVLLAARPEDILGIVVLLGTFAVLSGLLAGAQQMPLRLRSALFVLLFYAAGVVSLMILGIGGSGALFLLAFAVLTVIFFGTLPGGAAAAIAVLTWLGAGVLFSQFQIRPMLPPSTALFTDWLSGSTTLLIVIITLFLPQRQFLMSQEFIVTTSKEKRDLQETRLALEKQTQQLEVASQELSQANTRLQDQSRLLERRASQLAVSSEVARVATTLHDLSELLQTTATLVSQRFNFYHTGIFLLDDTRDWAVLQAASSAGGQRLLARGHRLRTGEESIVGYVASTGRPRIVSDVGAAAIYFANPDLPETHSEMAMPLKASGEIIGVMDIQSSEAGTFGEEDVVVLQILADQLGVAIDNARLFQTTQHNLEELRYLQRETRRESTVNLAEQAPAYRYDGVEVKPVIGDLEPASESQSDILHIPITLEDNTIGILELKREGEAWSPDDVEMSEAIASRMALALENARLFETTRVTLAETARLYNASRAVAAAQTLEDILRAIIAHALEPHFERFVIGMFDLDTNRKPSVLQLAAVWDTNKAPTYGLGHRYSWEQIPVIRHINALAPLLLESLDAPEMDDRSRAVFRAQNVQAVAAIPLVASGVLFGTFLAETRDPHVFRPEELRPLQALADLASVALENLRLLEETQQRIAELATINSISQTLTSQLELLTLTQLVGEKVRQAFGVQKVYIALYYRASNVIQIPYLAEGEEQISISPFPLGEGPLSTTIQTRETLILNQAGEAQREAFGDQASGTPAKSYLAAPIITGDEVIGVISVQNTERENFFGEADVRLLTTIAANVGVALQNARLFEQTQAALAENTTLYQISRAIAQAVSFDDLVDMVLDYALPKGADIVALLYLDYDAGGAPHEMEWLGFRDLRGEFERTRQRLSVEAAPYFLTVGMEPLVIADVGSAVELDAETRRTFEALNVGAICLAPLRTGSRLTGFLTVSARQPTLFNADEIRLLSTMSGQVVVAVEKIRLLAETQHRAEQLATAAEVSRASISVLNPDELITQAVELVRERFSLYYAALFLVDDTRQWAILRHATGEAGRTLLERNHKLAVDEHSMVGQTITQHHAQVALDVGDEATRFANPLLPDTRSEMALPLAVGQVVLGALDVQSTQPNAFAASDITVLQTMADQVAIAIRNAQLLSDMQRTLQDLDYERYLLYTMLENVPDKIYFKDQDGRFIRVSQAIAKHFGMSKVEELIGKTDFDFFTEEHARQAYLDEKQMLESGEPVLNKIERETWPDRPDTWALTSKLPLRDKEGKIIGSFGISRDVTELKAAQDTAQRRADQLAAAAEIARAATATLDLDQLLDTSIELVRERFGLYYAAVFIVETGSNIAVLRAATGDPGRQLKAKKHQLAVGSKSIIGATTASRQPYIVQDVSTDPVHLKNALMPDTRAEAGIPLLAGDIAIGALDVQSNQTHIFTPDVISILTTIADQLAVAMQNARLFDKTARQARREKLVVDITSKIRAANDIDGMLRTAVSELRQALGVSHGAVRLGPAADKAKPGNGNGDGRDK